MDVEKRSLKLAEWIFPEPGFPSRQSHLAQAIAALVREAVAEEREACAKIADFANENWPTLKLSGRDVALQIARTIRDQTELEEWENAQDKVVEDTWDERDEPW